MKFIPFLLAMGGAYVFCSFFPNNLTLAISWYCVFLLSALIMHISVRAWDIRRPTIVSIWYFSFLIMIYFPAPIVALNKPAPWNSTYLWGIALSLIAVSIGTFLANILTRFKTHEIKSYFSSPTVSSIPTQLVKILIVAAVLISTAIVAYYLLSLNTIPLLYMFMHPGDSNTLTLLREESFKLFDPRWQGEQSSNLFYVLLFLRTFIFPILITLILGYALAAKKIYWTLLFVYSLFLGGFYAASSIARAPLAAIFMRLFFFIYVFKNARLPRWMIILFGALIVAFPLIVTSLSHGRGTALNPLDTLFDISRRFTITPAEDLYYYFEVFPDNYPFQNGGTLIKPFLKVLNREYFYIENYVYKYISPGSPVETAHANAAFISNLYADFALPGVIIGSLLVGLLMQILQIYIFRQPKTVISITLFAFCLYAIWALNFGSVTSVLFVNGIIPVLVLYFIVTKFFPKHFTT